MLQKHYTSGTNELAESYNFDTRYQKESETVSDYIVALKKLSIHSRFGDEEQVKKRLSVRSDAIKNRLLSDGAALTWDKAVEISTSMDTAQQNSKMMKPAEELNNKVKPAEEVTGFPRIFRNKNKTFIILCKTALCQKIRPVCP